MVVKYIFMSLIVVLSGCLISNDKKNHANQVFDSSVMDGNMVDSDSSVFQVDSGLIDLLDSDSGVIEDSAVAEYDSSIVDIRDSSMNTLESDSSIVQCVPPNLWCKDQSKCVSQLDISQNGGKNYCSNCNIGTFTGVWTCLE